MEQYLVDRVLMPMRNEDRRVFCMEDQHLLVFFGSLLFNKPRCRELANSIRGYANLAMRYLLPLKEQHSWGPTDEIFIIKNGEILREAMMAIGKINQFYEDTDQFIADLENGAVR